MVLLKKKISEFIRDFKNNECTLKPLAGEKAPAFKELSKFKRKTRFKNTNVKYALLIFIKSSNLMSNQELLLNLPHISIDFNIKIMVISDGAFDLHVSEEVQYIKSKYLFYKYFVEHQPKMFLVDAKGFLVFEMGGTSSYLLKKVLEDYFLDNRKL
ncbi:MULTISPECIES: hypothetical protein [Bacillus cereus group]|uniref:hypothetical protein n=1 Tax=Bacillus cereus group TaxID=86661 RepID=UPI000BF2041E|nr:MULTISPECIES: hypothetical protein [Bacillus cereus group]PEK10409.1 hypothetical protein CN681_11380 [Bacillus toyonensis]PGA49632.1 hypothetical protein COL86_31425 [Bacillus toyonensis]PGB96437.1 hypothetical protein COM19_20845 [Bacillus toyonensis]PGU35084.1 hypothetical protein COD91_29990 [Bacillus cereus]